MYKSYATKVRSSSESNNVTDDATTDGNDSHAAIRLRVN
jgi:hypothetical protein